ncbi:MAG TPA: hypothetical protein VLH77_00380 [Gammaproteobacteria bacterium]|nr:hypothetical protein [Gammaproteobacteria bacterium]
MHERIIQGPRLKTEDTRLLEELAKKILTEAEAGREIEVDYDANNDMIVKVGKSFYNLSEILKHHPDWKQFEFTPEDIQKYEAFLAHNTTVYRSDPDLNKQAIRNQFPGFELGELNAIRNYTGEFYTGINFLLRANGKNKFPAPNFKDPSEFDEMLKKFWGANKKCNLNQLVTEIILHATMAAFALSKPIPKKLYTVSSLAVLQKQLQNIKGISVILIGQGNKREFAIVAYGEIVTRAPFPAVDLAQLLVSDEAKLNEDEKAKLAGLQLSSEQSEQLTAALASQANSCQEILADPNNPQELNLKGRLLGRLSNEVGPEQFSPEEDLKRADRHNPFMDNYLKEVRAGVAKQDLKKSLKSPPGFSSTSSELQEEFFAGGLGIVTHLKNVIGDIKNITKISKIEDEKERLAPPGQEMLVTEYKEPAGDHVYLEAVAVSSLNLVEERLEADQQALAEADERIRNILDSIVMKLDEAAEESKIIVKKAIEEETSLIDTIEAEANNMNQSEKKAKKHIEKLGVQANKLADKALPKLAKTAEKMEDLVSKGFAAIDKVTNETSNKLSAGSKIQQEALSKTAKATIMKHDNASRVINFFQPAVREAADQVARTVAEKKMKLK